MDNVTLGNNFIALGKALKKDTSTMKKIVAAANACGLRYTFYFEERPDKETTCEDQQSKSSAE